LPLRIAPGHGDDAGPQLFRPVVGPEPAGEQSVTVSIVHDVVFGQTRRHKTTGHELRPGLDVPVGVAHHGGTPGGARRGVETHHAAHGHGKEPEGIVVPEILFGGEGKARQVLQGLDVVGRHPRRIESAPIETHRVIHPLHHLLQALALEGFQGLPGQGFKFLVVDHGSNLPCFIIYFL